MDTRTLQELTDEFNRRYLKACESSDAQDWLDATLAGRHLVNGLTERIGINDILPDLQKQSAQ